MSDSDRSGGPVGRKAELRGAWRALGSAARVRLAAGVLVVAAVAGLVSVVIVGGDGEPRLTQRSTPCELFGAQAASGLLGGAVERVSLVDQLLSEAPAEQRRGLAAADEKTCAYVLKGERPLDGRRAALQVDRFLFRSVEEFIGAFEDSEQVQGVGRAAMIEARKQGGWNLSVLVDDEWSFALVVASAEVSRGAALSAARSIAEALRR